MDTTIRNNAAVSGTTITNPLDGLRARYARYQLYRATVNELSALSDRALADLGLSRSMIKPIAREAAYGK